MCVQLDICRVNPSATCVIRSSHSRHHTQETIYSLTCVIRVHSLRPDHTETNVKPSATCGPVTVAVTLKEFYLPMIHPSHSRSHIRSKSSRSHNERNPSATCVIRVTVALFGTLCVIRVTVAVTLRGTECHMCNPSPQNLAVKRRLFNLFLAPHVYLSHS